MHCKKPGVGSWVYFEDGLLEYKESELRKEWWYNVTEEHPYVTRNEKRRNNKPASASAKVEKVVSPVKKVEAQPTKSEPVIVEVTKKEKVKKEKKEKPVKEPKP